MAATLYHEVMPAVLDRVLRIGLQRSGHGEKTDDATAAADAYLDDRRPAGLREAGVSRCDVVYAYLSVDDDSLVDISSGAVVTCREYGAPRDQVLLRFPADPAQCFVADLDLYDRVMVALPDTGNGSCEALAQRYWARVRPLATYRHGLFDRPEVLVTQDIPAHNLQVVGG